MKKPVLFFSLIYACAVAFSQTIRIPQDFTSIQEAINVASVGDTILVDEGTYYENLTIPQKELNIGSLYLTSGDTSYISKTIIDGNQNGSAVSFVPGEFQDNLFTGFTIRNGNIGDELGGGIFILMSSPVLSYLKITNNQAYGGGAIACLGSPGLNLTHSVLSHNQAANRGAAILVVNSGLNISQCLISANELSGGIGGAISFSLPAALPQAPEVKMNEVIMLNNTASGTGATAGAYFENSEVAGLNILIENCLFQENISIGNTALRFNGQYANGRLVNCSFLSNEAEQYGAGVVFTGGSKAQVINSLFVSNKAATGGGQYNSGAATVWGSEVDFFNCTFVDNSASYGTVLTVGGGKASLENCILWDNNDNPIALVDAGQNGSELTISYSDVQNGQNAVTVGALSTLHWNSNNMDTDPLFTGEGDHPYTLDSDSPCIDAGNPDPEDLADVLHDFLGNGRIWDGDNDENAVIDMGPYEYGSALISSVFEQTDFHVSEMDVRVYPNPFSTSTTMEYKLVRPAKIILNIFDERGRAVVNIQEQQPGGLQQIILYRSCLATGIYYFRLQADNMFSSGKIILSE